jgi:hypothetical protein
VNLEQPGPLDVDVVMDPFGQCSSHGFALQIDCLSLQPNLLGHLRGCLSECDPWDTKENRGRNDNFGNSGSSKPADVAGHECRPEMIRSYL